MKPVIFHSEADAELAEAADYLDAQAAGLGREFRLAFEESLSRILENPFLYAIEIDDVRACPLRRFSHTIFYANLENAVWIVAISHHRRRPGYWRQRRFGE
ncbi:type II toxin-antitoxin system RelE/ParE family toxin [Zavarzinella formosa]|uniref:type II toxin-antitoxin system RelE/ParE family toxin n=1 Tax=Zavarzinella formosa TaxID=360055 RepID=UPI0002F3003F|nr:type II toxin-antitoxin system RelE/ParE family toxin [Zavarzinella formosa]